MLANEIASEQFDQQSPEWSFGVELLQQQDNIGELQSAIDKIKVAISPHMKDFVRGAELRSIRDKMGAPELVADINQFLKIEGEVALAEDLRKKLIKRAKA